MRRKFVALSGDGLERLLGCNVLGDGIDLLAEVGQRLEVLSVRINCSEVLSHISNHVIFHN